MPNSPAINLPTVVLFGVPIHALTMDHVLDLIHETIMRRSRLHIGVVNVAKIVNMHRNPSLREDVLSSDLVLADGTAVVWAARLLGCALPERVAGIDLMMAMLRRGNERRYRLYCLGATEEVSRKVAEHITGCYPNLKLVGRRNGYFSHQEEPSVADDITSSRPDILFVAMSSPKKEHFLARWSKHMGVPVCHGVGGSFDVLAGQVQRAPEAWQRLGLEWLYRVRQEPQRLWKRYFTTNVLFFAMFLREFVRQHTKASRQE